MNRATRTSLAGILAGGAALATTELVALAEPTRPSLLVAVETWFIDTFGGSLKDLAVELFGTADKAALAVGAVLVALALAPLAGRAEAAGRWRGVAVLGAFAALGVLATARDPQGSLPVGLAAAGAGVVVGGVVLLLLLDRFGIRVAPGADRLFADRRGATPEPGQEPGHPPSPLAGVAATRRDVVVWGLGAGALVVTGAAAAKGAGDALRAGRSAIPDTLPAAARGAEVPGAQPFSTPGLSPYVTPAADFYRIDTAVRTPLVDTDEWRLRVTGLVDRPLELSYQDLLARDLVEEVVTLSCVSNEVGGSLVGNAVWRGVPLRELLDEAGVRAGATQLVGESVDGFTAGFPTSVLDDPDRPALVALGMNGAPLPRAHGFPARLVISGLYGYVSATKWLAEVRLTTLEEDGYWIDRGWAKEAPVKTQSRIDVPLRGDRLVAGTIPVAGVAWAPNRGVAKVEVRIDRQEWQEAELGRVSSDDTWVQWHLAWEATPGDHVIEVRATDGAGRTQGAARVDPIPDGAEGWHTRDVSVAAR
ncbi:MAG TPA: molybdopterin-dependent oxidoreductase [Acidimicrobiales bacterium]|nr:molybdopterin-dependent oxidoreductase [Acidimicrobiales bacterium]